MLLSPHTGTIIWTIVTFLVVLFVLKATVWKPLLQALDDRQKRIEDALQSAEKAREEARLTLIRQQDMLAQAEEQAREIIRQGREAAEKIHQEVVNAARNEARNTMEQARHTIDAEKRAALTELRREVAELAVKAAGVIIEANLDTERNRKLVDDMIAQIPQQPAAN
jgi:F-type H+-transporting ATPase subunit b